MLRKIGQQMLTKLGQQMLTKIDRQLFHTIATDGRQAGAKQQMFLTYTIAFCHAWPILLFGVVVAVIPLLGTVHLLFFGTSISLDLSVLSFRLFNSTHFLTPSNSSHTVCLMFDRTSKLGCFVYIYFLFFFFF